MGGGSAPPPPFLHLGLRTPGPVDCLYVYLNHASYIKLNPLTRKSMMALLKVAKMRKMERRLETISKTSRKV